MRKNNFYLTLLISLALLIASCGCSDDIAINVEDSKAITKSAMIFEQGFTFKDKASEPIGMGMFGTEGSVNTGEFFDVIDTWERYETQQSTNTDVYIDMSGGVNYGIELTQEYLEEITLTLKNDGNYFKIHDKLEAFPISDYTTAYSTFMNMNNFDGDWSKLKFALDKCVNQKDKVSIFITDFLLDEGIYTKPSSLNSNITRQISEDGTAWAIEEFSDYFGDNNILEVVAVKYNHPKGTYGCKGQSKDCSKYLYYMFFTPRHLVGTNSAVNDIIASMKSFKRTEYIKIDPLSFGFSNSKINGVGGVKYSYPQVKGSGNISVINDFNVQFIPFNINKFRSTLNDLGVEIFKDVKIIDNLSLNDRKNLNSSPYSLKVGAKFYDITDFFYEINSIDKSKLSQWNLSFDPNNYPGNLKDQCGAELPLTSPRSKIEKDLFSFNDENFSITLNALALNTSAYFGGDVEHGKLYLCDIEIITPTFDTYKNDFLKWKFYNDYGYLENNGLIGSINKALQANKGNYKNKVLYSYIIALNDNK